MAELVLQAEKATGAPGQDDTDAGKEQHPPGAKPDVGKPSSPDNEEGLGEDEPDTDEGQ